MAFKMKGDPMGRNFGVGKDKGGAPKLFPSIDVSKNILKRGGASLTENKGFGGEAGSTLIAGGTSKLGTMGDEAAAAEKERKRLEKEHEENARNRTRTVIDPKTGKEILVSTEDGDDTYKTTGDYQEPKEWYNKKAFKETGIGHITDAVRSIARGIKKKKAKKAKRVEEAKASVGEGTETLKQAKLVKRAKKKEDRVLKRKIKDQKKLKKFREKNPVTGKEAIDLLASQTKKTGPPFLGDRKKKKETKRKIKEFKKSTITKDGKTYDKSKPKVDYSTYTTEELMKRREDKNYRKPK